MIHATLVLWLILIVLVVQLLPLNAWAKVACWAGLTLLTVLLVVGGALQFGRC